MLNNDSMKHLALLQSFDQGDASIRTWIDELLHNEPERLESLATAYVKADVDALTDLEMSLGLRLAGYYIIGHLNRSLIEEDA